MRFATKIILLSSLGLMCLSLAAKEGRRPASTSSNKGMRRPASTSSNKGRRRPASTTTTTTDTAAKEGRRPVSTSSTKVRCSAVILTSAMCGKGNRCAYKDDECKKYVGTESGTCLNDNIIKKNRPALLRSNNTAIFRLSVTNPRGTDERSSSREQRCNLEKNIRITPHDLELVSSDEKRKTRLSRSAAEILDAIFWLSDIIPEIKKCDRFMRFTIAIAEIGDEIILAGNLHFRDIEGGRSTWRTFKLDEPGVKLSILYILQFWGFPIDKVFVLSINQIPGDQKNKEYMRRHAEMQLVRFAKVEKKKIRSLGVSKPPCCLCDATLTDQKTEAGTKNDYALSPEIDVYSGPGTNTCGKTNIWCGHQYGAYKGDQDPKSWNHPKNYANTQWTKTQIKLENIVHKRLTI